MEEGCEGPERPHKGWRDHVAVWRHDTQMVISNNWSTEPVWSNRRLFAATAHAIIVMLVLGGLLILAQGSALAPFIYTLF